MQKMEDKDNKKFIGIGIVGGFIASLCCLGPVLLVMLGLTGVSFALSIGKYTWLFLSIGTLFIIISLVITLNNENCCNIRGFKRHLWKILIAFIIMAGILLIIKFWLATYLAQLVYR